LPRYWRLVVGVALIVLGVVLFHAGTGLWL